MDELMNKYVDEHLETFAGDKNTEELINEVDSYGQAHAG